MKRSLIKISLYFIALAAILSSCLKGDDMNTPPGGAGGTMMVMSYVDLKNTGTTLNSGLRYFGNAALTYPAADLADTATFWVSLQGGTLGKDLNITLKVDPNAKSDYYSKDSIVYLAMPDSLFTFLGPTTAAINAGKTVVQFQVIFYPSKIDPTQNYILPVTATNDGDIKTSSNYGHIYFHAIGNPIAGSYTQEWIRWNNSTGTGTPAYDQTFGTLFAPSSPTTITVDSGTGVTYVLSFKQSSGGALSDFKLTFDAASVTASGITITAGPTIVLADPAAHQYEFHFSYNNSSGSPRVIFDKFN